jgi:hypothetical protein
MLDQAVKSLLRRQAFVNVDHDGHVADAQRRTRVYLFVRGADRPLHGFRVCVRGIVQAVVIAADA